MPTLTRWKSPPQRSDSIGIFHYGPLKSSKTGIRLAQIQPGSGRQAIHIVLIDAFVTGPQVEPYDALSYTWGESTRNKNIICNGKHLAITEPLLEALHRFRDSQDVVTIWCDQICICQDRLKERNQQVDLMGSIFKRARKVIVWLGDDYADSKAGMQLAKQLLSIATHQQVSGLSPADLEYHGLPKRGHRRWVALAAILRRPWFWRTWVVQEVVLNPHVELVLGSATMTWEELEAVVSLLEGELPRVWHIDQAISATELPFSRINRIRLRHHRQTARLNAPVDLDVLANELTAEPLTINDEDEDEDDSPELLDLLLMSRGLGATDPRDKIYALLALGKHDINADYSMTPESVFTDFALQTIGVVTHKIAAEQAVGRLLNAHDLDFRRAMIMMACAGRQNQNLKLPSWVPDWTVLLASRPLVFGVDGRFAAGGEIVGTFDWDPETGFLLDGILLDTVQAAGSIHLDHDFLDPTVDPHALVRSWWKESQQIALERIAKSPGSVASTDAFEAMRRRLGLCRHGYYVGEKRHKRQGSILDEANMYTDDSHSITQTFTLGCTRGRVAVASCTGFIGLGPHGTQEGDLIFIIRGADVPYVLRPHEDGVELIGEAYIQGVMDGEALQMQLMPQDVMMR